jgi:hypothetical protein
MRYPHTMNAKEQPDRQQKTRKGLPIPIPKREDFIRNLKKVAKKPGSTPGRPKD